MLECSKPLFFSRAALNLITAWLSAAQNALHMFRVWFWHVMRQGKNAPVHLRPNNKLILPWCRFTAHMDDECPRHVCSGTYDVRSLWRHAPIRSVYRYQITNCNILRFCIATLNMNSILDNDFQYVFLSLLYLIIMSSSPVVFSGTDPICSILRGFFWSEK